MIASLLIVCATILVITGIAARALLEHGRRRAQLQREAAMYDRAASRPVADLAAAVAALEAAATALQATACAPGPSRLGQRVTVHTKAPDDRTFFGVVTGDYTDRLVLEDAEIIATTGGHPLPGRQDIARSEISWIDLHGHVAALEAAPALVEE